MRGRYRKKPVVIEAMLWDGGDHARLDDFCGLNWGRADAHEVAWNATDDDEWVVVWNTLEKQWLCCPKGHWLIRGMKGELYPCDPAVFSETYEPEGSR